MSDEDHDDRQNSREDLEAWRSAALLKDEPDPGPIIDCPACGGALFARDDTCLAGAVERIAALKVKIAAERERRQREDVAHMKVLGEVDDERIALKARLRETAQILIAKVGADGPMNAEDAARKAVKRIAALEADNARSNDSRGIVGNVLRYVLFALTRSNEVRADLCDDVQMAADAAVARISELETAVTAIVEEFEDVIQEADRPTGGMSVPFHSRLAGAARLPSVMTAIRWWARELRATLNGSNVRFRPLNDPTTPAVLTRADLERGAASMPGIRTPGEAEEALGESARRVAELGAAVSAFDTDVLVREWRDLPVVDRALLDGEEPT